MILHNRIVELRLDMRALRFETTEQQQAFYAALGRSLCWGLSPDVEQVDSLIVMVDKDAEITTCYSTPAAQPDLSVTPMADYYGSPFRQVLRNLDTMRELNQDLLGSKPRIVIGAVPRNDRAEYSFHS